MINQIVISGNLGGDPETFYTPEGTQITSFSIAFKSTKKDKTCWIKVTAFTKLSEIAEKYLHKGDKITVIGLLDQDKWESNDGTTKSSYKIIANSIEFNKLNNSDTSDNEPF